MWGKLCGRKPLMEGGRKEDDRTRDTSGDGQGLLGDGKQGYGWSGTGGGGGGPVGVGLRVWERREKVGKGRREKVGEGFFFFLF